MGEAGRQEKGLAIENVNLNTDGIPFITVIVDGGWSQRSFNYRYSAKSGVACIIGAATKKLLFIGVRSKYCYICATSGKDTIHKCYKNWDQSSPAMESDILIEGFKSSVSMHGLEYRTIIGDGDSSVHKKLQDNVEYGMHIKKSECANHVVRNYRSKLYQLAKTHKESLTAVRIVRLGKRVRAAISHVSEELAEAIANKEQNGEDVDIIKLHNEFSNILRKDIRNSHQHVFGKHDNCRGYFCDKKGPNKLHLLTKPLEIKLLEASQRVQDLAKSLMDNETNNLAENYMSLVAKATGGKQVCYNRKGSYFTRCRAAALQFQLGRKWHPKTIRSITNISPFATAKVHAARSERRKHLKKRCLAKQLEAEKNKEKHHEVVPDASNYGINCEKPDMTEEDMSRRKVEILEELSVTKEEKEEIQKRTANQASCDEWFLLRKKRLTSSNFGTVVKRKASSGYAKLVQRMLYSKPFSNPAVEWGKSKESIAIKQYQKINDTVVEKCGFFIDEKNGYLGASPDGLVGDTGLVEVKCPYSARFCSPIEAPSKMKTLNSILENDRLKLKKKTIIITTKSKDN